MTKQIHAELKASIPTPHKYKHPELFSAQDSLSQRQSIVKHGRMVRKFPTGQEKKIRAPEGKKCPSESDNPLWHVHESHLADQGNVQRASSPVMIISSPRVLSLCELQTNLFLLSFHTSTLLDPSTSPLGWHLSHVLFRIFSLVQGKLLLSALSGIKDEEVS